MSESDKKPAKTESIVLGGGCFWCLDAIYRMKDGVVSSTAGYAGGNTMDPTYEEVSTGQTGHAEVVKIKFDPEQISLKMVLELFWQAHDPTTPNQQGFDIGTQYRSIILYKGKDQKAAIDESLKFAKKKWGDKLTTEIKALQHFYEAEDYHQDYFQKNLNAAYCQAVISPKIKKLAEQLK